LTLKHLASLHVEYTVMLMNGLERIRRRFKTKGLGVLEDFRFSKDVSTVPVRNRNLLSNRETFESVFENTESGVLYAYDKKTPTSCTHSDNKRRRVPD